MDIKEKRKKWDTAYHEKNPGLKAKWNKEWIANNRDKYNAAKWNYRDRVKRDTFTHYAGGVPTCACCGIVDIDVLVLDHVNDDGAEHRRSFNTDGTRRGGLNIYEKLKKAGFPEGLQVLCHNCNWKKEMARRNVDRLKNPFYTGM